MIGEFCGHRWSDAKRLVNPGEIVTDEVQGDRRRMVLHFLRESVSEPGKATHRHPHGEVLPLHKRCAGVCGIGATAYGLHIAADALGRAVTLLRLIRRAVNLLKLGIVYVRTKGILHSVQIGLVPIRC